MNREEFKVFFKVQGEIQNGIDMQRFGEHCIKKVTKFARIINIKKQQSDITFVISFSKYSDADSFIHQTCYEQYNNELSTIAFWFGTKPNFEVFVSNGPKGMTRRDLFLAFEKFGAIGKATVSKSKEGTGWVSFVNRHSYMCALNSIVYIRGEKVRVSMNEGNADNIPVETMKNTINFSAIIDQDRILRQRVM